MTVENALRALVLSSLAVAPLEGIFLQHLAEAASLWPTSANERLTLRRFVRSVILGTGGLSDGQIRGAIERFDSLRWNPTPDTVDPVSVAICSICANRLRLERHRRVLADFEAEDNRYCAEVKTALGRPHVRRVMFPVVNERRGFAFMLPLYFIRFGKARAELIRVFGQSARCIPGTSVWVAGPRLDSHMNAEDLGMENQSPSGAQLILVNDVPSASANREVYDKSFALAAAVAMQLHQKSWQSDLAPAAGGVVDGRGDAAPLPIDANSAADLLHMVELKARAASLEGYPELLYALPMGTSLNAPAVRVVPSVRVAVRHVNRGRRRLRIAGLTIAASIVAATVAAEYRVLQAKATESRADQLYTLCVRGADASRDGCLSELAVFAASTSEVPWPVRAAALEAATREPATLRAISAEDEAFVVVSTDEKMQRIVALRRPRRSVVTITGRSSAASADEIGITILPDGGRAAIAYFHPYLAQLDGWVPPGEPVSNVDSLLVLDAATASVVRSWTVPASPHVEYLDTQILSSVTPKIRITRLLEPADAGTSYVAQLLEASDDTIRILDEVTVPKGAGDLVRVVPPTQFPGPWQFQFRDVDVDMLLLREADGTVSRLVDPGLVPASILEGSSGEMVVVRPHRTAGDELTMAKHHQINVLTLPRTLANAKCATHGTTRLVCLLGTSAYWYDVSGEKPTEPHAVPVTMGDSVDDSKSWSPDSMATTQDGVLFAIFSSSETESPRGSRRLVQFRFGSEGLIQDATVLIPPEPPLAARARGYDSQWETGNAGDRWIHRQGDPRVFFFRLVSDGIGVAEELGSLRFIRLENPASVPPANSPEHATSTVYFASRNLVAWISHGHHWEVKACATSAATLDDASVAITPLRSVAVSPDGTRALTRQGDRVSMLALDRTQATIERKAVTLPIDSGDFTVSWGPAGDELIATRRGLLQANRGEALRVALAKGAEIVHYPLRNGERPIMPVSGVLHGLAMRYDENRWHIQPIHWGHAGQSSVQTDTRECVSARTWGSSAGERAIPLRAASPTSACYVLGVLGCGWISRDGGRTWHNVTIPDLGVDTSPDLAPDGGSWHLLEDGAVLLGRMPRGNWCTWGLGESGYSTPGCIGVRGWAGLGAEYWGQVGTQGDVIRLGSALGLYAETAMPPSHTGEYQKWIENESWSGRAASLSRTPCAWSTLADTQFDEQDSELGRVPTEEP